MKIPNLRGKCFLCGRTEPSFDTGTRVCDCLRSQGFPPNELPCYVTVLPEPCDYSVLELPSLWARTPSDVFAVAAGSLSAKADVLTREIKTIEEPRRACFPFIDLLETDHHLRCGNATVYRSVGLEDLTGSALVMVLDMGSYYWSGTLKDPRSWAIINTALACDVTDISVWTAGNAGISLAKLAYFTNRRLLPEARLQIHAIVDNEVAPEIRAQLRLWQCEVLDLFRQDRPVLNPAEIRGLVAGRLRRSRRSLKETSYWHVTDGWDGIGLLTYRLIAAQVLRDLSAVLIDGDSQPIDVILPVGTGDLLLGFYLGLKDCERAGLISPGRWRLVGALPAGANILANIRQRSIPGAAQDHGTVSDGAAPVMPKLKGLYTPLAPCLTHIEREGSVEFIVVTEADQLRAGRQVLSGGIDEGIVAEPSALATFAALPYVCGSTSGLYADRERAYHCSRRVLVINSGLGVLGRDEEIFLQAALGSSVS